jgi:phospholipase C
MPRFRNPSRPTLLRGLALFVGFAVVLALAVVNGPRATPAAGDTVGIHKIKHVIVIMQENRSFDEYFGTFPGADPDEERRPDGVRSRSAQTHVSTSVRRSPQQQQRPTPHRGLLAKRRRRREDGRLRPGNRTSAVRHAEGAGLR